jgi:hypothetical protein
MHPRIGGGCLKGQGVFVGQGGWDSWERRARKTIVRPVVVLPPVSYNKTRDRLSSVIQRPLVLHWHVGDYRYLFNYTVRPFRTRWPFRAAWQSSHLSGRLLLPLPLPLPLPLGIPRNPVKPGFCVPHPSELF